MLRRLLARLGAVELALALLGLLTLAMALGGTLPQRRRLASADFNAWRNRWPDLSPWLEWSGLTDIYASAWFSALALMLVINLALAMAFHLLRTRTWLHGQTQPTHALTGQGEIPAWILATVGLRQAGTKLSGTWGLWGIPLLHAGIVVVVLASFAVRSERFAAHLELAEGESFTGQSEKLVIESGDRIASDIPIAIRIDALEIEVQDSKHLRELNARLSVQKRGGTASKEVLRVNAPVAIGGYEIYLAKTFGWTAVFDRVRPNGEQVRLLVNFPAAKAQWPDRSPLSRQTSVSFDNQPLNFDMRLTPGDTPRFGLFATQENKKLFDGEIHPGEVADLGHYRLIFRGCVPWAGLYLTKANWTLAIFFGYALALVGMLLHLLLKPRRISLARSGYSWTLHSWAMPGDIAFERTWAYLITTPIESPNLLFRQRKTTWMA